MAKFDRLFVVAAFAVLGACETMPADTGEAAAAPAPVDAYAGKSVLDAAIAAAGGEANLRRIKEIDWTASGTQTIDGKTTEIEMQTRVRPFTHSRTTSWPKAEGEKAARTVQTDFGGAWTVNRVSWTPMTPPEAAHENQQYALYGVMTLVALKDTGAKVTESAPGQDGTRNLHVEHPKAPAMDLRFDKDAKLIRASYSLTDPKGGAPIPQVAEFSGEVVSNGVKWPKKISIRQNNAPYLDYEIATFEARETPGVAPLKHTLEQPTQPGASPRGGGGQGGPPGGGNPG